MISINTGPMRLVYPADARPGQSRFTSSYPREEKGKTKKERRGGDSEDEQHGRSVRASNGCRLCPTGSGCRWQCPYVKHPEGGERGDCGSCKGAAGPTTCNRCYSGDNHPSVLRLLG